MILLFQCVKAFQIQLFLICVKDEIYNADRYQDIDKLCPPGEPKGRVNPDSQGGGFFRPFLVVNARFDKKLIFSGRNVPECHAIVFIDCVPRIS